MLEMIRVRQSGDSVNRNDLFSNLLEANDGEANDNSLSEEELMGMRSSRPDQSCTSPLTVPTGNIFIFLLAGHETTSNTLTFAFALLALHPDIQEELCQHIESVFPHDRDPVRSMSPFEGICSFL